MKTTVTREIKNGSTIISIKSDVNAYDHFTVVEEARESLLKESLVSLGWATPEEYENLKDKLKTGRITVNGLLCENSDLKKVSESKEKVIDGFQEEVAYFKEQINLLKEENFQKGDIIFSNEVNSKLKIDNLRKELKKARVESTSSYESLEKENKQLKSNLDNSRRSYKQLEREFDGVREENKLILKDEQLNINTLEELREQLECVRKTNDALVDGHAKISEEIKELEEDYNSLIDTCELNIRSIHDRDQNIINLKQENEGLRNMAKALEDDNHKKARYIKTTMLFI